MDIIYGAPTPKKPKLKNIINYTLLTMFSFLFVFPLFWLMDVSFRPKIEIFQVPPRIFQAAPWVTFQSYSFDSFIQSITKYHADIGFINSVFVTMSGIILTLLICSLAAYAFATMRFPGRNVIFMGILVTMMLPTVTMIAPYYRVLRVYGILNSHLGLILPYAGSAFGTFLLRQYITRLPVSLFEAAVIDGASQFRIWWRIVLPLAKPALAALAIYQFRDIWNDFLKPMIILRSDSLFTLPITLQFMDSVNIAKDYNCMVATGFVAVLIPIIFFILFQRQFIEGLSGGIKE